MGAVQDLVDNVLDEGGIDATPQQALQWLSRRHVRMCARSGCYRLSRDVGPTVANQRDYPVGTDVVEIYEVLVGGVPYGKLRHVELAEGQLGWLWLAPDGAGMTAPEETAAGLPELALFPTPGSAGLAVLIRCSLRPGPLATTDDSTLKVPEDFHDDLVAGAIATGWSRIEQRDDMATGLEARFKDGCEELRRQMKRKYRGTGPTFIRIVGVNA
jgi:hypothetical protein